jgi:hypothetical protein
MKASANNAGNDSDHIVPFYSERTLACLHTLVKHLDGDLAVYVCEDRGFATIGTHGIRPFDGTPGLIIHLSVYLGNDKASEASQGIVPQQLLHNPRHTSASEHDIKTLLIGTLEASGFIPAGARSDALAWHFF